MLKCEINNTCEGNGIIERIEGNGWDIDADHIELNGINAHIVEELECRCIFLDGPAVEDLFKNLSDLLKENGKLRKENTGLRNYIDEMKKSDESVNCCANDVLITETLHLRQIVEEQDERIKRLEKDLKEKEAVIKDLQFDRDHYIESCKILKRSIEEKNNYINKLDKYLGDKNAEIDELNDKLKKYDNTQISLIENVIFLESALTIAGKMSDILNFIREAGSSNSGFAVKTFPHFIPDYDITVSVSRKEETNVENNKPGKYDITKEMVRWLDEEIKNNTDYATKIFNKESKENIFSITFCKVPVESEVVTNEQD